MQNTTERQRGASAIHREGLDQEVVLQMVYQNNGSFISAKTPEGRLVRVHELFIRPVEGKRTPQKEIIDCGGEVELLLAYRMAMTLSDQGFSSEMIYAAVRAMITAMLQLEIEVKLESQV